MFKTVIVGLLAVAAVPAFAQGSGQAFNGPFIGVQGGWQQDRLSVTTTGANPGSASVKGSGFAYGGQLGYDLRFSGNAVIGVEGSLTGRTGSTNVAGYDLSTGRTFNATARLGYVVAPSTLVYARGGYSNARFSIDNGIAKDSGNRDGFTVGGGIEQVVARNVSARLEYAYSDYGSENVAFGARAKLSRNAVTAGLNYRF
jgi:outer membrane immunogenic protein